MATLGTLQQFADGDDWDNLAGGNPATLADKRRAILLTSCGPNVYGLAGDVNVEASEFLGNDGGATFRSSTLREPDSILGGTWAASVFAVEIGSVSPSFAACRRFKDLFDKNPTQSSVRYLGGHRPSFGRHDASLHHITPEKMSVPQIQKAPVPSVVVTKMNPPVPPPKNVVFKKTTPDKTIAVYLDKRDFVDHVTHTDPVDAYSKWIECIILNSCTSSTAVENLRAIFATHGLPDILEDSMPDDLRDAVIVTIFKKGDKSDCDGVLVLDTGYIKDRKVFCRLICAFRYGPDDIDVCGMKFKRELYRKTFQIYPPISEEKPKLQTKLQERLTRKFGDKAYPFCLPIPDYLPCSITLQLGPNAINKCCGVDFQIFTFCAKTLNFSEKISKRSSVTMVIRKVQYAPDKPNFQPMAKTTRQFLGSDKPLHLEASLNKEIYYHGEPIQISIEVINHSNKTVKKLKIIADQIAAVVLYSHDKYNQTVAVEEVNDQVGPGCTLKKVYQLCPIIADNREKHGLALDGKIRHEDINLASTTILKEGLARDVRGILVSYKIKVKLIVSGMLGDVMFNNVAVELPFLLMHPKREPPGVLMMTTFSLWTLIGMDQWQ
uniref:S-arrestin-like n=1 Tax=Pristiophorus japonicus TaxID=55135 RepID=UPI00398EFFC8